MEESVKEALETEPLEQTEETDASGFSREQRIAFCRAVAHMIAADHVVTEDERLYLAALVRQTGLSLLDDDLNAAIDGELANPTPLEDLVAHVTDPELRRALYRTLVEVAYCDDGMAPEEEEKLTELASMFELNKEAARDLIHWTQNSIDLERREAEILARL